MDQQQGQEQILNNPQNLEQYNNNEQSQKNEFLEQILKAKANEDLIQWLVGQLNQAKVLCFELTKDNMKNQETHLKNLMHIIDNSLEKTKNSKISLENDISNNSVSQESYCNQGTSISCQDNFLTNINYVSDMNKQIVIFNQAILHSSQEDDQLELQRGSEQFRHSEQYSDYYQMHNHQQQQKQMSQIMDQEVDIQSPINHRINQEQQRSITKKISAISEQIKQYKLDYDEQKGNIQKIMQDWYKDVVQNQILNFEAQIDKQEKIIQYYNQQQKQLEEKLEQYQFIEFVANENTNIVQISQKHSTEIQSFISKENLEVNLKNKINEFVAKNFKALNYSVQKIFEEQSKSQKIKHESQLEQLKQELQKEINEKQQFKNELSLYSYNDQSVGSKIKEMQELLKEISQKTIQTTKQLDDNSLDQLAKQIKQISRTITKETEREIEVLNQKLEDSQKQNEQLKKEKQNLENKLKNNESSQFLSQVIEQFQQKQDNYLNQQDQINEKTNKLTEIKATLNYIINHLNNEKENLKQFYQEEKNKEIQTQLEGCFKLQDKSLLYIQLGLKIFQQYYLSENSDDEVIKNLIAELIKFHKKYQEKLNFSLKGQKDIEKFYTSLEKELKKLYDDSLEFYKKFISDIQLRRRNQ